MIQIKTGQVIQVDELVMVDLREHYLGAVAQLGEHLLCKQGVVGSIPSGSTIWSSSCCENSLCKRSSDLLLVLLKL